MLSRNSRTGLSMTLAVGLGIVLLPGKLAHIFGWIILFKNLLSKDVLKNVLHRDHPNRRAKLIHDHGQLLVVCLQGLQGFRKEAHLRDERGILLKLPYFPVWLIVGHG